MSNNRLYHRQCFRRHERASSLFVNDVGSQSSDNAVDVLQQMTSDDNLTHKATSQFTSTPSTIEYSDRLSSSQASKMDHTSPRTSSPVSDSCLPSSKSLVAGSREPTSVKPSANQEDADKNSAVKSVSQVNTAAAAADVSLQEMLASAHQQINSSVVRHDEKLTSEPTAPAVTVTEIPAYKAMSVEASVPAYESVPSISVIRSPSPMDTTVSDKSEGSEQLQNKVDSETGEKTLPGEKSAKTSVSESSSSSSAVAAAESAPQDKVITRLAPVSPVSHRQAPADAGVKTVSHSPGVDICLPVSSEAVKLPSGSVSTSAHDVSSTASVSASAVLDSSSSESVCTTVHHPVRDSHRIVPRRPAPLPPRQIQQQVSNKQISPVPPLDAGLTATSEPSELSQHIIAANQQVIGKPGLQSDVQPEQQSSKEAVTEQCKEQTALDHPIPIPRRPRTPKLEVFSADVEMSSSSTSLPELPVTMRATSDNETVAVKPHPVPKPRKSAVSVIEPDEMADKGKPDIVVKHIDIELSEADRSLDVKSKTGNTVITDSCLSTDVGDEPGKKTPMASPRSPRIGRIRSPAVTREENKSPSFSPSSPVKLPRSKKHRSAPQPPQLESPNLHSPEPVENSGTKPESRPPGPPQRPVPPAVAGTSSQVAGRSPTSPVGTSSQVTSEHAGKSPTVSSETVNPEPVRRKIIPAEKFTFETDAFQAPKPTAAADKSASAQLKPSRPAPPRPAPVSVSKRKVCECVLCINRSVCLTMHFVSKSLL